uniref:Uncharacterized protein n=1 Tax=Arundo donax TaxID=35708 RepID=A0A0A8Z4S0_ARUDO
MALMETGD